MRCHVHLLAWSVLLLAVAAAPVLADPGEVVLRNGDVLRGDVTRAGDRVVVEHATLGRIALAASQVVEVRAETVPVSSAPYQAFERPGLAQAQAAVASLCGGADPCAPAPCAPAPCAPVECAKCWKLKGALAASLTAGNSDSLALAAAAEYTRKAGRWDWLVGASYIYNQSDGDVTAERWYGVLRSEYALSTRSYLFGKVTFDRDEPADLEYRVTAVAGYGYYFVKTDRTEFKGEAGGGVTWEKYVDRDETVSPSAYAALHYLHTWADKREFRADLEFFPNLDDFDLSYGRLFLGYKMPLTKIVNLVFGARFDYVIAPPDDADELDVFLTLGLSFEV